MLNRKVLLHVATGILSLCGAGELACLIYRNYNSKLDDGSNCYKNPIVLYGFVLAAANLVGYIIFVNLAKLAKQIVNNNFELSNGLRMYKQILYMIPPAISNLLAILVYLLAFSITSTYMIPLADIIKYIMATLISTAICKYPKRKTFVYGMGFCIIGITIIFIGEIFYMLNQDEKYSLEVVYDVVCILAIAVLKCFSILWIEELTQRFDNSKNRMHLIININEVVLALVLLGINCIYAGTHTQLIFEISQTGKSFKDQIIIFGYNLPFIFDKNYLATIGIICCAVVSYFCYYWIIRTSLSPYTSILSDSFKAFIFCIGYVIAFKYSESNSNNNTILLQYLAFSMFGYLFILFGALIMNKILYKRTESSIASPLRNYSN